MRARARTLEVRELVRGLRVVAGSEVAQQLLDRGQRKGLLRAHLEGAGRGLLLRLAQHQLCGMVADTESGDTGRAMRRARQAQGNGAAGGESMHAASVL